jgi:hypothetical protein
MRRSRVTVLLPVVFFLAASQLGAEDRTLLVSGVFADSSIVGPVVRLTTRDYSLTLLGGTLEGSWVKRQSPRRGWILSADVTPFNAHLSNRIYVQGERAHELEYEAASHRIRGGLRLTPTDRSTTDIQLVGLLERITDIDDATVRSFWEGPFLGLDVSHAYQNLSNESPLIGAFNGFTAGARFEVFAGPETWSRVSIHQRSGIQLGNIHLRQSLLAMSGKNLNVVNRTLIGGSWDVLAETAMYGHRFGEYRVARGVLANAGADYVLPRNWRVGLRASYLRSDVANLYGSAINVSKVWKTFGFNAGIGKPQERNGKSDAVFYLAVIAPLYVK